MSIFSFMTSEFCLFFNKVFSNSRLLKNRPYTFQISKEENVKCTTIANHRKLGSSKKEFKRQKIESR